MNKLKITHKEYQILSPLLVNMIGKKIFSSNKEDWNEFEQNNKNSS